MIEMEEKIEGSGTLVLIPTYNERDNVGRIVPAVLECLPSAHVLVVDDNSPDGTGNVAERIARQESRVHVLHRRGKDGLGRAYLDGFRWALEGGYRSLVGIDADLSHDPKDLATIVRLLADNDLVVGSRRVAGGGFAAFGPVRRFLSWGGSLYTRAVLGLPTRDPTSGFLAVRSRVLEHIGLDNLSCRGYAFLIELKYRAYQQGFRIVESEIVFRRRRQGRSKLSARIVLEALVQVWRLRFTA